MLSQYAGWKQVEIRMFLSGTCIFLYAILAEVASTAATWTERTVWRWLASIRVGRVASPSTSTVSSTWLWSSLYWLSYRLIDPFYSVLTHSILQILSHYFTPSVTPSRFNFSLKLTCTCSIKPLTLRLLPGLIWTAFADLKLFSDLLVIMFKNSIFVNFLFWLCLLQLTTRYILL